MSSSTIVAPAKNGFKHGMIVRIKLKNFMTFSECELVPGPTLNLIIGPNGTGKSSVVCAIALGLGGTPAVLNRANKFGQFVKHGEEKAIIQIELFNEKGKNDVFERILHAENVGSKTGTEWKINDKSANGATVLEKLSLYKVQIDNLCQFLPQDRVGEFSGLDEHGLLTQTIKAVLGDTHEEEHKLLVEAQKNFLKSRKEFDAKVTELHRLEGENARTEGLVEKQKERQGLLEHIANIQKKIPWMEFEAHRVVCGDLNTRKKQLDAELKEAQAKIQPIKDMVNDAKKNLEVAHHEFDRAKGMEKKEGLARGKLMEQLREAQDATQTAAGEIEAIRKRKAELADNIAKQEKKVAKLEKELGECRPTGELDAEWVKAKNKVAELSEQKGKVDIELSAASSAKTRIEREKERIEKQIAALMAPPKPTYTTTTTTTTSQQNKHDPEMLRRDKVCNMMQAQFRESVQEVRSFLNSKPHQDLGFQHEVIGPMCCDVYSLDDFSARVLEQSVPISNWLMFVTQTFADRDRLASKKWNQHGPSQITILKDFTTIADAKNERPKLSPETMAKWGIKGYLDQLIGGDPSVIEALRKMSKIHHILIASGKADELGSKGQSAVKELYLEAKKNGFTQKLIMFTPKTVYDMSTSSYTNEVFVMTSNWTNGKPQGANGQRLISAFPPVNVGKTATSAVPAATTPSDTTPDKNIREDKLTKLHAEKTVQDEALDKASHKVIEIGNRSKAIKTDLDTWNATKKELQDAKKNITDLNSKLTAARKTLREMQDESNEDFDQQEKAALAELGKTKSDLARSASRVVDASSRWFQTIRDVMATTLAKDIKVCEKDAVTDIYHKYENTLSDHDAKVKALNKEYVDAIDKLKKLKAAAEAVAGPLNDALKAIFQKYPNDREALLNEIDSYERRVQGIFEDKSVLDEYLRRRETISRLTGEVDKDKVKIESDQAKMDQSITTWEMPVRNVIQAIDVSFRNFFEEIRQAGYQVAGQIELVHEGNDLSTYGVGIKVKFREQDELVRLQKERQSGGERAITTFLYLLSLQEHAMCAFRVVDEINQGMDNDKERLAFYRLVHQSQKPGSPQYFYITPKLLRRLEYSDSTVVHHVFNGPYSTNQSQWNLEKLLQARRKRGMMNSPALSVVDENTIQTTTSVEKDVKRLR